jgi:hypothetical protein
MRDEPGDFAPGWSRYLKSAYLAAGTTPAAAEISDGAGGRVVLKLSAAAYGDGSRWSATDKDGVQLEHGISLATIDGDGASVTVEFS